MLRSSYELRLKALFYAESNGTTYMYLMTQQPSYNHDPAYGPVTARKAPFCECDHGDDIVFTFGLPLCKRKLTFNVKFTNEEKLLSKDWMKYIVNFARNGYVSIYFLHTGCMMYHSILGVPNY